MRCGCAFTLATRQPESVFGSPEAMVERGVEDAAEVTAALAAELVKAASGKSTAAAIKSAVTAAGERFGARKLAKPIERELTHGSMLGALDSWFEVETDQGIALPTFAQLHSAHLALVGGVKTDTSYAARPIEEAIKRFLEKKAVTREVFDEMVDAAKRKAFTVAEAANQEMVRAVKRELVRQVAVGADLADFGKHAAKRLEQAGWTPQNPSHLENVFRTNVLGAYNGGRARQMSQPEVLAARPFWQILGITDGRQRKTHRKMHGVILAATDPFWTTAYPPFGYQCRCRARSLSLRRGAGKVQEGKSFKGVVPDPGFASGLGRQGIDVPDVSEFPRTPANDPERETG